MEYHEKTIHWDPSDCYFAAREFSRKKIYFSPSRHSYHWTIKVSIIIFFSTALFLKFKNSSSGGQQTKEISTWNLCIILIYYKQYSSLTISVFYYNRACCILIQRKLKPLQIKVEKKNQSHCLPFNFEFNQ